MDLRILLLVTVCTQLATVVDSIEDFIKIYNIVQELTRIYNRYSTRQLDITPGLVKKLTQPLPFPQPKKPRLHYDFIIVGCGSSGSVLANRLSANPKWSVLVLEAGQTENVLSRIPMTVPVLLGTTEMTWNYKMEVDPNFGRGLERRVVGYPRGKTLGGSSVINYMIYSRGAPEDYDKWQQMGNPGWSYEDLLPYFLKSEASDLRYDNPQYHSTGGFLSVEDAHQTPLAHTFIKAGGELGYQKYTDYNSHQQFGFTTIQATTLRGRRHTTARAFLSPIKTRPNLHILLQSHVTKILIEPTTKQAYGVRFLKNKIHYEVYAKKEIILSSGAVNTPQILMLSGVGPRKHLEEIGIKVVQDLPVGRQLYDHLFYYGLNFVSRTPLGVTLQKIFSPTSYKLYQKSGRGPWSTLGGIEALGFIKTNASTVGNQPDVELLLIAGTQSSDCGLIHTKNFGITDKMYNDYWGHLEKLNVFTIFPILLHPKSRGLIKLRSKHPLVAPLIYGNHLSDAKKEDIKTLIAGIRYAIRLVQTRSFAKHDTYLDPTPVPGCGRLQFGSDPYWECALRTFSYPGFDPMGTVKMGPRNGSDTALDHELRVYGIKGLRVADMSIPPVTLSGHSNAQAIMIGEKASDLIKTTWKNQGMSATPQRKQKNLEESISKKYKQSKTITK